MEIDKEAAIEAATIATNEAKDHYSPLPCCAKFTIDVYEAKMAEQGYVWSKVSYFTAEDMKGLYSEGEQLLYALIEEGLPIEIVK